MKSKKEYISPELISISIDQEINLVLVSGGDDPGEPGMDEDVLGFTNQSTTYNHFI
jgi:hypothetical protein